VTSESPRGALAGRIADFVDENGLAQVFGGRQDLRKEDRYYSVSLSLARYLDGFIRVYGPKFILIQMQGPYVGGAYEGVYESEENALAFLKALLVDCDQDAAYRVPTKPKKT
jgi:hypothetical protein